MPNRSKFGSNFQVFAEIRHRSLALPLSRARVARSVGSGGAWAATCRRWLVALNVTAAGWLAAAARGGCELKLN